MFAAANTLARGFTYPMIISSRRWSGGVDVSVGAFVVLNRAGWIVTAAHIFQVAAKARQDAPAVAALAAQIAALRADPAIRPERLARDVPKL